MKASVKIVSNVKYPSGAAITRFHLVLQDAIRTRFVVSVYKSIQEPHLAIGSAYYDDGGGAGVIVGSGLVRKLSECPEDGCILFLDESEVEDLKRSASALKSEMIRLAKAG